MKNILALILMINSVNAWAGAVASVYKGVMTSNKNVIFLQDADDPKLFYYVPTRYHLASYSYRGKDGKRVTDFGVTQSADDTFSTYTMHFVLDAMDNTELYFARIALENQIGKSIELAGMATICGVRVATPGFGANSTPLPTGEAENPRATTITYGFSSSEGESCSGNFNVNQFTLEYRVPVSKEPETANQITGAGGLVLPSVELILPSTYKVRVTAEVKTESAIRQLKAAGEFEGTFKVISAKVDAAVSNLLNSLKQGVDIHFDCPGCDAQTKETYMKLVGDYLSKKFYQYSPLGMQGNTDPLVIGDKDKNTSGLMKVGVGADYQTATHEDWTKIDFTDQIYSTVKTQALLDVRDVSRSAISEATRKKLDEKYPERQKDSDIRHDRGGHD